jgi:hypothetical protein
MGARGPLANARQVLDCFLTQTFKGFEIVRDNELTKHTAQIYRPTVAPPL